MRLQGRIYAQTTAVSSLETRAMILPILFPSISYSMTAFDFYTLSLPLFFFFFPPLFAFFGGGGVVYVGAFFCACVFVEVRSEHKCLPLVLHLIF